jgi:DivIVA domain-containing protein
MSLTPADVRNKQFGMTRLRPGYIDDEVDAFLDAIEAALDRLIRENEELRGELATGMRGGIPRVPGPRTPTQPVLTPADVRNKHFGLSRLRPGYIDEEVDEFLIEVENELEQLTRENEELRARLSELSSFTGGAQDQGPVRAPYGGTPIPEYVGVRGPGYGAAPRGDLGAAPAGYMPAERDVVSEAPPARRQWMEADIPVAVPQYGDVEVTVRICGDPRVESAEPRGTRVTLVAHTRWELAPTAPQQQSLTVLGTGTSDPVRFSFHATRPGLFKVKVSAFAGGTFLGELTADVSVESGGRLSRGPVKTAELAEARADQGDVTLHVRSDGAQYIFQLLADSHAFEPVVARELSERPLEPLERTMAALRAMSNTGHAERNARSLMAQTGAELWNRLVPDAIKEQFWQLRPGIAALSVLSEQEAMPWEVVYPLSRGSDAGFLVEQFPVLRRISGQRPADRISLGHAVYAVPPDSAGNRGAAAQEISAVRRALGSGGEEVDDMDRLLDKVDAGDFGVLHFACHGTFLPDASGSSITLGGGRLIPAFLNPAVVARSLAGRSPLVFVNSSRISGMTPEYTRLSGWAEQFMGAGAGAFAGASWAVRPAGAAAFAGALYDALQEGQPLGRATSMARKAVAAETSDPAWLAYSVWGAPAATVTRSPFGRG